MLTSIFLLNRTLLIKKNCTSNWDFTFRPLVKNYLLLYVSASCPASTDLGLLIQLQVKSGQSSSMVTVAWTRINLFDQYNRLVSGYWRLPLRVPPIQANTPGELLNNIPQVRIKIEIMRTYHQNALQIGLSNY